MMLAKLLQGPTAPRRARGPWAALADRSARAHLPVCELRMHGATGQVLQMCSW